MPQNAVTDPITDQEIAFAHLVLSGTMTDRQAAEAAGLNPSTAAYTKSKPHVRDYMIEHRAAVSQKLIDQEAEALRNRNLVRDQIHNQILNRLWQLANLSPEVTRGSVAAQVKAMSMILAVEGLIPDRRASPVQAQPASTPVPPQSDDSEAMRRQPQTEGNGPHQSVTAAEAQPITPPVPEPPARSANHAPSLNAPGKGSYR